MKTDGLMDAYRLIVENEKKGTVDGAVKVGKTFEGEEKAKPKGDMGTDSKAAKSVKSPQESGTGLNSRGKGETGSQKNLKEAKKEIHNMLPESKFDMLFKSQLVEEESISSDESPIEQSGAASFDDDKGDFPSVEGESEGDIGEEVDVATELRLIIDRLTEVAERLGAYDSTDEDGGDPLSDISSEPEGVPPVAEASQAMKELKPLPDSVNKMTSKGNFKVKSDLNPTGKGVGSIGGPGHGEADGKAKAAKSTTLGPKMSMKADAKGPVSKPGAGLFDSV